MKEKSCSLYGLHPSVKDCQKYLDFGQRITTELESSSLTTALSDVDKKHSQHGHMKVAQVCRIESCQGKKHIAVTEIFTFDTGICPTIVRDIRFLAEGGKILTNYGMSQCH